MGKKEVDSGLVERFNRAQLEQGAPVGRRTKAQTAERLGRSPNAVQILYKRGKLAGFKDRTGKLWFEDPEIDRFILGEPRAS